MNIKLIHILNNLTNNDEQKSIKNLSKLKEIGVNYIQYKPQSYKKIIEENFTDNIDCLIVCKYDSILNININYFLLEIKKTLNFCKKYNLSLFSWGGINNNLPKDKDYPYYCITNKNIEPHFIIFPQKNILDKIDNNINFLNFFDKIGCSIPELAYQNSKYTIKNKNISNNIFQISYNEDLNRIYIFCPIKKLVKINIYTWNHQTNDIEILFHDVKEFNNNSFWFQPDVFIMKYGGAKISILDNDDNVLTEKYMI